MVFQTLSAPKTGLAGRDVGACSATAWSATDLADASGTGVAGSVRSSLCSFGAWPYRMAMKPWSINQSITLQFTQTHFSL